MSDYFAAFDLPRKLGLDTAALEREFYARSRKLHPDLFARKSAEEQQWSLQQSSLLNDAYRTLKDPLRRTEYLLKLEGVRTPDENAADRKKQPPPADLLEEAFELNMQLEEMRMNRQMGEDDPQLRADLEKAQAQFTHLLNIVDSEIESAGSEWDRATDAGEPQFQRTALDRLSALLDRRSYLRNLVRDVNEALGV